MTKSYLACISSCVVFLRRTFQVNNRLPLVVLGAALLLPTVTPATWNWAPTPLFVGNGTAPQVAAETNGAVTLIWLGLPGAAGLQSSRYSMGGWSVPVAVTSASGVSQPQLVVDGNAIVTAVWQREAGSDSVIEASRYSNGAWSVPVLLSAGTGNAINPQLAVNASGSVMVLWQRLSGANAYLQSSRYSNGLWSAPVAVSATDQYAQAPALATLANGDTLAVWQQFLANPNALNTEARIQSSRYGSGGWSVPGYLNAAGHHADQPRLATDGLGNAQAL